MQIQKVFNNNVALALDKANQELIVMGKGLAFGKKTGDIVEEERIEKMFVLSTESSSSLNEVYKQLPAEEIDAVVDIINYAEETLGQVFQSNVYVALGDHIHFTIERTKKGLHIQNPLLWEVRKFYPNEYAIGERACLLLSQRFNIQLDASEAASIALHLVNAQKEGHLLENTIRMTEMVHHILDIVRLHFGVTLDENSIVYHRFITHLQYFAQRVMSGIDTGSNDSFLYEQIQANYPEVFRCTQKIKQYVQETYQFEMGRDEQVYLTIHIQKLIFESV